MIIEDFIKFKYFVIHDYIVFAFITNWFQSFNEVYCFFCGFNNQVLSTSFFAHTRLTHLNLILLS